MIQKWYGKCDKTSIFVWLLSFMHLLNYEYGNQNTGELSSCVCLHVRNRKSTSFTIKSVIKYLKVGIESTNGNWLIWFFFLSFLLLKFFNSFIFFLFMLSKHGQTTRVWTTPKYRLVVRKWIEEDLQNKALPKSMKILLYILYGCSNI